MNREQTIEELAEAIAKIFRKQARLFQARSLKESELHPVKIAYWMAIVDTILSETSDEFTTTLQSFLSVAMLGGARRVIGSVGGSFTLEYSLAVDYLKKQGADLVTQINEVTRTQLRKIVTAGLKAGESHTAIQRMIINKFGEMATLKPQKHIRTRAHLIAITEYGQAFEHGGWVVVKRLQNQGIQIEKFWNTRGDDRVSKGCHDNQKVGWVHLETKFPSGHKRPLRFPGCRCWTAYRRKKMSQVQEAGRVMSRKNLDALQAAKDALNQALKVIDGLIESTEKTHSYDYDESSSLGDLDLIESSSFSLKEGTKGLIKIINSQWGASGYYPHEVLQRDGPSAFPVGTQMFWDHATLDEDRTRPEGSLNKLAGQFTSPARWENGPEGPGLYADVTTFEPFSTRLKELKPYIGVSIRAEGEGREGIAEGKKGMIITCLTRGKSVDFVTKAGAGGKIVTLKESDAPKEQKKMNPKEYEEKIKKLEAEVQHLRAELKTAREKLTLRHAKDVASEAIKEMELPDVTRQRILESVRPSTLPLTSSGQLDEFRLERAIKETARREVDYLEQTRPWGQPAYHQTYTEAYQGSAPPERVVSADRVVSAYRELGLSGSGAKLAAKQ